MDSPEELLNGNKPNEGEHDSNSEKQNLGGTQEEELLGKPERKQEPSIKESETQNVVLSAPTPNSVTRKRRASTLIQRRLPTTLEEKKRAIDEVLECMDNLVSSFTVEKDGVIELDEEVTKKIIRTLQYLESEANISVVSADSETLVKVLGLFFSEEWQKVEEAIVFAVEEQNFPVKISLTKDIKNYVVDGLSKVKEAFSRKETYEPRSNEDDGAIQLSEIVPQNKPKPNKQNEEEEKEPSSCCASCSIL